MNKRATWTWIAIAIALFIAALYEVTAEQVFYILGIIYLLNHFVEKELERHKDD